MSKTDLVVHKKIQFLLDNQFSLSGFLDNIKKSPGSWVNTVYEFYMTNVCCGFSHLYPIFKKVFVEN